MIPSLFIGQSNQLGALASTGGPLAFDDGLMVRNNNETAFGNAWVPAQWGEYPLHRVNSAGAKVNNLIQGFSLDVTAATGEPVYAMQVAKGSQPVEVFMPKAARVALGAVIPSGKTIMAPYIFDAGDGAKSALDDLGVSAFDVVIQMQGEADNGEAPASYAAKWTAIHDALYAAGIAGPDTIFLMAGLVDSHPYYSGHKAACAIIAAANANAHYVDSAGLLHVGDNTHFRGTALVNLGKRLASKFIEKRGANP